MTLFQYQPRINTVKICTEMNFAYMVLDEEKKLEASTTSAMYRVTKSFENVSIILEMQFLKSD